VSNFKNEALPDRLTPGYKISSSLALGVVSSIAFGLCTGAAPLLAAEPPAERVPASAQPAHEAKAVRGDVKMDKATKDLGGANASDTNKNAIPLKPISAKKQKQNDEAANAINKVPGINIQGKDLQPPAEDPEIKGFHPIKRLMAPVIRLGKGAVEMQQDMMKLSGPVGALEPAMGSLQVKLQHVADRIHTLDGHLVNMDCHVTKVSEQMIGVKEELGEMKDDVRGLQKPLSSLLGPLGSVDAPLVEVKSVLADIHTMMTVVLLGITVLTLGIIFGTPLAALYVYAHRRQFFPDMKDHEFPLAAKKKVPAGSRR